MASVETVEKLRERANVSYEEAGAALDSCGGDLLEALIMLEKQGKVNAPSGGDYSSKNETRETQLVKTPQAENEKGESFSEMMNRFFKWCGKIIHKGNTNFFEVWRENKKILTVPVTVLILLLIFAFWVTLPLMVIGLFMSCRYSFQGGSVGTVNVNDVMGSAADAATTLKNEVMNAAARHDEQKKK